MYVYDGVRVKMQLAPTKHRYDAFYTLRVNSA